MNKLAKRAWTAMLLAIVLLAGTVTIVVRYFRDSEDWYLHSSNAQVYTNGVLNSGMIYDRSGILLLDATDGRSYPDDEMLRRATLHLLGDTQGNIPDYIMEYYSDELTGYDLFNGAKSADDTSMELTVSAQVQKAALDALAGQKGTVGVYNYKTGEILCMVSTPSFDPENPSEVDDSEAYEGAYINRFLHASYTPGSTFKLVTAVAAISEMEDLSERTFQCGGSCIIDGEVVKCNAEHGEIGFDRALTKSCNVVFAQLAVELGAETLTEYAQKVGIADSLSFDGLKTTAGNFDLEDASEYSVAWAGVGQYTNQINPCQYLTFMGAIANGGKAAMPYLVERIQCGSKQTYAAQTTYGEQVISTEAAQRLTEAMHTAVVDNYGEWNFAGLYAGAKSGTAERGGDLVSNALFAGFVQDENYPLAFIVVVEGGGSGSQTCIPIVSQVLNACVAAMDTDGKEN